jgi:hypothetical protein
MSRKITKKPKAPVPEPNVAKSDALSLEPAKKAISIEIHKAAELKLLDAKLLRRKSGPSVLTAVAVLLIVAGSGFSAYYLLTRSFFDKSDSSIPEIVVPAKTREAQIPAVGLSQDEVSQAPTPKVEVQKVQIGATPTGFLNVRKGPGTSYEKVGQVNPGELFDLLSEDVVKGWYEIRISATTTGWVTKQYASIKTEN